MEITRKTSLWYYAWIIMVATVIMNFFYAVSYSTFSLYTASILERFPGLSRTAYSFVPTLQSASSTIFLLSYGKIVKKIDLKLAIALGGLGFFVGFLLYSFATNIFMFYVGALFVGLFPAFCSSTTTAMLFNRWFGKLHATLLAISMTIGGFGGTFGSVVIGKMLDSIGYAAAMRYIAILVIVVTAVIFFLVKNNPDGVKTEMFWTGEKETSGSNDVVKSGIMFREAKKTYNFWALVVFFVLFAACFYAAYANVAVYMADMGLSAAEYGAIFGIVLTVNNITMIPGGFVADKLGARLSLIVVSVLYAIVAIVLGFTKPTVEMMYIVCGLIGLAFLFPKILPAPMVRQAFGVKDAATIQGILTACITVGASIGVPAANIIYDLTGSYAGLFKSLVPIIVICIVLGFTGAKKVKGWDD